MVTPEEAETKVCPVMSNVLQYEHCMADRCMFWKWNQEQQYHGPTKQLDTGYCGYVEK